jgi:hypothetical protein
MSVPVGGAVVDVGDIASAQAASNLKPACRLLQTGAATSLPSGTQTAMTWDTEDYDYGGLHVAGAANVIVTRAGLWRCVFTLHLGARADYTTLGIVIQRNGVNQAPFIRQPPTAGNIARTVGPVVVTLLCALGDTLTAGALQQNTAAVAVTPPFGSSFESAFEVEFVRDA